MTQLSSFRVYFVRLVAILGLVGLTLAALASDGRATFIYAVKLKVPNNTGVDANDFDVVVDTGTLAAGGASNEAPNIVGSVQGAFDKGPFNALTPQNIANQPTQKLAHYGNGGTATAGNTYTFAFGLKQKQDVKVAFPSADWTNSNGKIKPTVATAGFAAPLVGKDQQFTLFDDTSVSFDLVNVSVLVNSPGLDLSTLDPGNAPGFTSVVTPISLGVPFDVPGTVDPGNWAYIQGSIFDPSVGQTVESFIYGDSVQVSEPSDMILLAN
jgi:hypothetical protein